MQKLNRLISPSPRQEKGFTLIETLVAIIIAGIVIATVTATVLLTRNNVDEYTVTVATQESVTNATASIAGQALISPTFMSADGKILTFSNPKGEILSYMYYDPTNPLVNLADGIDGKTPQSVPDIQIPSLIERRTYEGETYSTITILVSDVDMFQADNGLDLFTYYNGSNQVMTQPVTDSGLSDIKRFAIRIVALSDIRKPIEVATSVSPNAGTLAGITTTDVLSAPTATVLRGTLPRPQQNASLNWVHVAGATSYVLYRDGSAVATFGETDALSYIDTSRPWGTTQEYYVIASGPGGSSVQSNTVSLTVVPQRPIFVNVVPTAVCNGNTVARDLSNCLAWNAPYGTEGYRLYRGGTLLYSGTGNSYTDTGRSYGDTTSYTVVAWNTGQNGSGGDSITSSPASLISPPRAPIVTGSDLNGARILNWVRPTNAMKYQVERIDPSGEVFADILNGNTLTFTDSEAILSLDFTYRVRAGNNAGWGPWSSPSTVIYPNPSPPSLTIQDYVSNPATRDGNNYISWSPAPDATSYDYRINGGASTSTTNRYFTDTTPGWDTRTPYEVRSCNITGCSDWTTVYGLQPPGPYTVSSTSQQKRSGYTEFNHTPNEGPGLVAQSLTVNWGVSSGADAYSFAGNNVGTARSGSSTAFNPGAQIVYTILAHGTTSGISRPVQYNFQAAPATVSALNIGFATRNGLLSRSWYTANTNPVIGTADGAQSVFYRLTGPASAYDFGTLYSWGGVLLSDGFKAWNGSNIETDSFNKGEASPYDRRGAVAFVRTQKSLAAGYNLPDSNYASSSGVPTTPAGIFQSPGLYSFTSWWHLSTGSAACWSPGCGAYDNVNWVRPAASSANYPGVTAGDSYWGIGGR